MNVRCLLGHDWVGCACRRCGQKRDEGHDWDGCTCRRCDGAREHDWEGPQCRRCKMSLENLSSQDMRGKNLRSADLSWMHLCGKDLSRANLSCAKLRGTNLSSANLHGVNLHDAYLSDANLSNANLNDAYLGKARLNRVNLRGAILDGADLSFAYLDDISAQGVDLSRARNRSLAIVSVGKLKHLSEKERVKELLKDSLNAQRFVENARADGFQFEGQNALGLFLRGTTSVIALFVKTSFSAEDIYNLSVEDPSGIETIVREGKLIS